MQVIYPESPISGLDGTALFEHNKLDKNLAGINQDPRYVKWLRGLQKKVFTETETLEEMIIFNFTHVDVKPGYNETHTKRYRFHAHAMRPELNPDI